VRQLDRPRSSWLRHSASSIGTSPPPRRPEGIGPFADHAQPCARRAVHRLRLLAGLSAGAQSCSSTSGRRDQGRRVPRRRRAHGSSPGTCAPPWAPVRRCVEFASCSNHVGDVVESNFRLPAGHSCPATTSPAHAAEIMRTTAGSTVVRPRSTSDRHATRRDRPQTSFTSRSSGTGRSGHNFGRSRPPASAWQVKRGQTSSGALRSALFTPTATGPPRPASGSAAPAWTPSRSRLSARTATRPVGDHRAQALERPCRALLRDHAMTWHTSPRRPSVRRPFGQRARRAPDSNRTSGHEPLADLPARSGDAVNGCSATVRTI